MDCDIDSSARNRAKIVDLMKQKIGQKRVINMCAFKTETPKSCVQVVCRGLGINDDEGRFLSSLIPVERGKQYSFDECYNGNEDEGKHKVQEFINKVEELSILYNKPIKESLFLLEGIISSKTIHASAVLVTQEDYTERFASMKAPNGTTITAFEAHDCEYMSGLKEDMLTIECLDLIENCLLYLIEDNVIEWQGSWKKTYDKYLHPKVLDLSNQEIWEKMANGDIINIFQFSTIIGEQCIRTLKPKDLYSMAVCNSIMRIISENGESPMVRYERFKNNISLWYQEMDNNNLTEQEKDVMKSHLDKVFGVTTSQEEIMLLSMDKNISNFDLKLANKLRKACAKGNPSVQEEIKREFYSLGLENETRQEMLDYVWNFCIKPLMKYAFSIPHTVAYSLNGFMEAQLATKYNRLYWDTANLTVNASAMEDFSIGDSEENEVDLIEEEVETNEKSKTANYGKIAKAIGDLQSHNVVVSPPYINKAKFSFSPDIKGNQIIYSLKAVSGVADDIAEKIVANQPYENFEDFMDKIQAPPKAMYSLIKGGCFDEFEKNRIKLMRDYVNTLSPVKSSLNGQNIPYMLKNNLLSQEMKIYGRYYKYRKYILDKNFFAYQTPKGGRSKGFHKWYRLNETSTKFFMDHFMLDGKEGVLYAYDELGRLNVCDTVFQKVYEKKMEVLKSWMNQEDALKIFNESQFNAIWQKNCGGTLSKWEMESLCYYHGEHELKGIDRDRYCVSNFFGLDEQPKKVGEYKYKGYMRPMYPITRICGTIIDRNNTRHTITLLTEEGVVNVKMYAGTYTHYNKQISITKENGDKEVIEKSWFTRGTKLFVCGYRFDNQFIPKVYKDTPFDHTIQKILELKQDGTAITKSERERL